MLRAGAMRLVGPLAATLLAVSSLATPCRADPPPALGTEPELEPAPQGHGGFALGVAGGVGAWESRPVARNIPYGESSYLLEAEVGYSVTPAWTLLARVAVQSDTETDPNGRNDVGLARVVAVARVLVTQRLWVEAGFGRATLAIGQSGEQSSSTASGTTIPFGVGIDCYRAPGRLTLWTAFQVEIVSIPLQGLSGESGTTHAIPVGLLLGGGWY